MLKGIFFFLFVCLCNGSLDPQYQSLLRAIAQEEAALMDLNELEFDAPVAEIQQEEPPPNPNLNNTRFCPVTIWSQVNAMRVEEGDYEMLGYLVAGQEMDGPMQCTVVCIKEAAFIAPVGCIATAKTNYTSVIYKRELLRVANFIIPSNGTKQTFDDIGIITVFEPANNNIQWSGATMMNLTRSDPSYTWFDIAFSPQLTVNLVGYIRDIVRNLLDINWLRNATWRREHPKIHKSILGQAEAENFVHSVHSLISALEQKMSQSTPQLYALDKMYASNKLCNRILTTRRDRVADDYWVPCVHSCTVEQHFGTDQDCYRCNFGPGHAVMDAEKRLIGLISWSCGNEQVNLDIRHQLPLPLGVTVPNSRAYREALHCANAISKTLNSYKKNQIICNNISSSISDDSY